MHNHRFGVTYYKRIAKIGELVIYKGSHPCCTNTNVDIEFIISFYDDTYWDHSKSQQKKCDSLLSMQQVSSWLQLEGITITKEKDHYISIVTKNVNSSKVYKAIKDKLWKELSLDLTETRLTKTGSMWWRRTQT